MKTQDSTSPIPTFSTFIFSLLLCTFSIKSSIAQDNWKLSQDHAGIKIYTRPIVNSKLRGIKVECDLQATPSQLLAAILDVKTCNEWVYHSKLNVVVKQISPLDLIYYSEIEVPWPAENRDFVVHVKAEQQPKTKVITVNSPCIAGYVEEKDGVVRIKQSEAQWKIIPAGKNQVRVEYILEVDPLGNIPAWLINLFATTGPYETFKKLKVHLEKAVYKNARFAGITD